MTARGRWAGIVAVSFIWGSTWLAIKIGLGSMPPFLSAGMRFAIAAGVPIAPASPTPFAPSGLCGDGVSTNAVATGGISAAVRSL